MRRLLLPALALLPTAACSSLDDVDTVRVQLRQRQVLGALPFGDVDEASQDSLSLEIDLGCASHGPLDVTVEDQPAVYTDGGSFTLWSCDRATASFDDDLLNPPDDGLLDIRIRSSGDELGIDVPSTVLDRSVADVTTLSRSQTVSFPYAVPGTGAPGTALSAELVYADGASGTPVPVSSTPDAVVVEIPGSAATGPAVLTLTVFEIGPLNVDNDLGITASLLRSEETRIAVDVQ